MAIFNESNPESYRSIYGSLFSEFGEKLTIKIHKAYAGRQISFPKKLYTEEYISYYVEKNKAKKPPSVIADKSKILINVLQTAVNENHTPVPLLHHFLPSMLEMRQQARFLVLFLPLETVFCSFSLMNQPQPQQYFPLPLLLYLSYLIQELMNDRVNQLIGQYTNNFLQLSEKIDGTNSSLKTIGCGEDSIKTEIEKLQEQYTDSFQQLYQKLDNTNSFLENIVEVIEDEENTIKNENGKISKLLSGIKEIENEIKNTVDKLPEQYSSDLKELLQIEEKINQNMRKGILNIKEELEVNNETIENIEEGVEKFNEIPERMVELQAEFLEELQKVYNEGLEKSEKLMDDISNQNEEISSIIKKNIENFIDITEKDKQGILKQFKKIMEYIIQLQDEFMEDLKEKEKEIVEKIEDLTEGINDQNGKITKSIKNKVEELINTLQINNEEVVKNLQDMAGRYEDFKEYNEKMMEKVELMTDKDYEILKGYLTNDGAK